MTSLFSRLRPVAVAIGMAACAMGAQAANLVGNGSFEQGALGIGSFSDWQTTLPDALTFVDSSGQTGMQAGQASDGLWSAYFGSTSDTGGATIAQSLATVAGQTYVLSFDVANDNAGMGASDALSVQANGATLLSFANLGDQGYAHQSVSFTASGSTLLSFTAYNDNGYLQLDNVSVTAVPEPDGLWIAATGLAALALTAYRRKA
ncbi:MAG: hypothetical protein QM749_11355 [Aquabacterium sp.]